MAKKESPLNVLEGYLPDRSFDPVVQYIIDHKVHLTITRERSSILGNYSRRPNRNHKITVNGNLNKYSFLITLLHELAHLLAFEKYGTGIPAHGQQWKSEYSSILSKFTGCKIFPADIEQELLRTLKNPAASSCAEDSLLRILRKYDAPKPGIYLLEDLPGESVFKIKNGRLFQKGNRVRKRFLCRELSSQKMYLFSPVAEVFKVE